MVVSDDGKFAYVSHAVGAQASRVTLADKTVTAISLHERDPGFDTQTGNIRKQMTNAGKNGQKVPQELTDQMAQLEVGGRPSCQGFALAKSAEPGGRILAPQVLVDNGDASQRAPGYGNDESPTEVSDVAVIDATTGRPISVSLERPAESGGWGNVDPRDVQKTECLLPRAAAVDPASKSLLVSCYGLDQVIAYDSLAREPGAGRSAAAGRSARARAASRSTPRRTARWCGRSSTGR